LLRNQAEQIESIHRDETCTADPYLSGAGWGRADDDFDLDKNILIENGAAFIEKSRITREDDTY
jgi:hypothetical protein